MLGVNNCDRAPQLYQLHSSDYAWLTCKCASTGMSGISCQRTSGQTTRPPRPHGAPLCDGLDFSTLLYYYSTRTPLNPPIPSPLSLPSPPPSDRQQQPFSTHMSVNSPTRRASSMTLAAQLSLKRASITPLNPHPQPPAKQLAVHSISLRTSLSSVRLS